MNSLVNKNIDTSIAGSNPDDLILKLKNEDARNLRISKNFQWIYWILIPIYAGFFILNPDDELNLLSRISGACYVVSFIIFAFIFRKSVKEYKAIDYSLPTLEMMKQAVKRYHLWQPRLLWALLSVLFIDAGLIFSGIEFVDAASFLNRFLWIQATFLPAIGISFGIGVLIWSKRQKPLRDQALRIIKELIE
ncbi:MAG TPA: hypothetical protein DCQ26_07495 [Marinilabiliales bacterium]|nr:MAG: hypothetical protein A2W95_06520 [Bacteroidetes bacterium GWA2_40_14]OFX64182.1 MAG: hypothetical protein A2W84_02785 [Bacteroidetes bacterium GWC2_40_13]OFX71877.1 MAG: hypothetical protein A2W96_06500 [Bacteroidetes bacterium GWD2_40_43]OFX94674.1 MAG: hypothetical protein A2W97_18305 [Bacteroidetes bacterium GWE2_40_63]OFY24797.1 MAG: hypothetical protein A2W88_17010 [Bacteroidetes bacterium GWF2_40_13]OFZ24440.1 MAG: hypothetical protein A2437_18440 [Bacteroidetes bacterium RIFOXYC